MIQRGVGLLGLVSAVVLLAVLGLVGCGGGGSSGSTSDSANTAQLRVALTDATGTYASVVLAIKEIRVVPNGSGGLDTGPGLPLIASFSPAMSVDVLTLSFQQQLLGQAAVPTGTYEQVRLVLAPNPVTGDPVNYATLPGDPTKLALTTPSGQESGLKVVGKFEVKPGIINAIALDFNPEKSIVSAGQSGKLLLKPTGIRTVQMSTVLPNYGSLSGAVLPADVWPSATVSIIPPGGGAAIAMGSVSPDDGTFRAFLPPGVGYTIRVTNPGFNPYDSALLSPPESYTVTQGGRHTGRHHYLEQRWRDYRHRNAKRGLADRRRVGSALGWRVAGGHGPGQRQ